MTSIKEAAGALSSARDVLLLTHRRPDGDTLGSAAALCRGLRMLGKTAYLIKNPETTAKYASFVADLPAPEGFSPGFVAAIDVAGPDMLPANAETYAGAIDLVVDHHPTNKGFGRLNCVYPGYAATGEIVYALLCELGAPLSREAAEALYVAVSTDTGCFKYSNTTANTHRVAAAAMDAGIDAPALNRKLFFTKSRARITLERSVLGDMRFYFGGRVAVSVITRRAVSEAKANDDDIDDLSALPRQIEGVDAGVTIRELEDGCKISLRTSENMDASRICARFGGGGHLRAAGCNHPGTAEQVCRAVLQVISEEYPDVGRDTHS